MTPRTHNLFVLAFVLVCLLGWKADAQTAAFVLNKTNAPAVSMVLGSTTAPAVTLVVTTNSGGGGSNDPGTPSVVWAKVDSSSGTVAIDSSTAAHNGSVSSPTWTAGKFGNCINVSGASSAALFTHISNYNLGTGDYYVSVWFNTANVGTITIFMLNDSANNGSGPQLIITGLGKVSWFETSAAAYNDGQWHNAILNRSSGTLTMYVDGVSQGGVSDLSQSPQFPSTAQIGFGVVSDGTSAPFNGLIDDLRIDNKALTAGNITWLQTNP